MDVGTGIIDRYLKVAQMYHDAKEDVEQLCVINADLLAACKEISYYFHCMTDEDLRLIADMMGDPPPIGAVDAAIAKAKGEG